MSAVSMRASPIAFCGGYVESEIGRPVIFGMSQRREAARDSTVGYSKSSFVSERIGFGALAVQVVLPCRRQDQVRLLE